MVEWSKWHAFLDKVPEKKGVYQLGTSDYIYYIGQSDNIQRRLKEHLHGNDSCINDSTLFRYYETPYHHTEEEKQLKDYKLKYGKLPKCNDQSK